MKCICGVSLLLGDVCRECARAEQALAKARAKSRRRYAANRVELLAKNREWRRNNPEKMKAWRARNKDKASGWARQRTFGITAEDFAAMLAAQGGVCAICRTDKPGGTGGWHLDHDHVFDRKDRRGHRGVLCSGCNRALGYFKDNVRVVKSAFDYLGEWTHNLAATRSTAA
jgi:hypothetical protein